MSGRSTRASRTTALERTLAQQGAVAALTALGRLRGTAAGTDDGGTADRGLGAAGSSGAADRGRGGFSSPARAVRRPLRGSWRSRF
ncbi:hypothetical protein [Brevibacterium salitolerans]|uniref:Uncharacterized protein n=1 Tax=Brevibacterium salitolerans TaxID=1403566 RepID=A0ABP5HWF1_9MICO